MASESDQHEYFLKPQPAGADRPGAALWRRTGARWEFLSLLDWAWHEPVPSRGPTVPRAEWLRPLTPQEAAELAADRQRWVRYWAWYLRVSQPDRPRTVVRRRRSPERVLDEVYTFENRWERTPAIVDFEHAGLVSDPPHLVEIDQATAERILHEVRGVQGATEL